MRRSFQRRTDILFRNMNLYCLQLFSAKSPMAFGEEKKYLPHQPETEQQRPPRESLGLQRYALVPPQELSGVNVRFCLPK